MRSEKFKSPGLMLLYERVVLAHPRVVLTVLALVLLYLGYRVRDFRLDASAESLILEHDPDLSFQREINARYHGGDFLLLTYSPRGELFSPEVLHDLKALREQLRRLPRVASVVTILDVPLLRSPPVALKDLGSGIRTLESPGADSRQARRELIESPLFQDLLISRDGQSTALQINFAEDPPFEELSAQRTLLRQKAMDGPITPAESAELDRVAARYRELLDRNKLNRHEDIARVRAIMDKYRDRAELFLGGVSMVSDDMISFIRNDLRVFGLGMLAFLVLTLAVIFRRPRWVILPMLCCAFSTLAMMGLLGIFDWQVTVISANFISLQLIITMSLTIHLIVRFREVQAEQPHAERFALVQTTVRTIFKPCLYTSLTTIAGFCSLMVCDILPVVNFGWMMTAGLVVSFCLSFLFFPAAMLLLPESHGKPDTGQGFSLTGVLARFADAHGPLIYTASVLLLVFTVIGILRLKVENSFIDYFKSNTEIYRGMQFIDRKMGGTTPLDVVINLETMPAAPEPATQSAPADDFANFGEFEGAARDQRYWFTAPKMAVVENVHRYLESLEATGKVLSLNSLLEVARQLIGKRQLDNFDLALLFGQLPETYKSLLINPFVSVEKNQVRLSIRIKDSMPGLERQALLKKIQADLTGHLGLKPEQVRLAGIMVLYNNMLQSLFRSQIQTIALTVLALMLMFLVLFRSLLVSLIAIVPNLLASLVVLGLMGLLRIPLDMMTITIVAISVGIAVDNTIHYLHRFKREFALSGHYHPTMFRCHASIGKAMYYTSLTVIVGFGILAGSNFIPTVLFGLLTGLAMVIALVAALTLLPRLILLFKPFGPESNEGASELRKSKRPA
jgi:predicted RND superfamily exporter protein